MIIRLQPAISPSQGAHKFRASLGRALVARGNDVDMGLKPTSSPDVILWRGPLPLSERRVAEKNESSIIIMHGGCEYDKASLSVIIDAINNAHGVIFNSIYGMENVKEAMLPIDVPMTVIRNGTKASKPSALVEPVFLVAFEHYRTPDKDRALRAIQKAMPLLTKLVPGASLRIAGEPPDGGAGERIGLMNPAALAMARRSASVLVHLHERDHCPNTVVESMACGMPVVCHANGCGAVEMLRGTCPVARSHDPVDVAKACAAAWDMRHRLQRDVMSLFSREMDINIVARRYEEFAAYVRSGIWSLTSVTSGPSTK